MNALVPIQQPSSNVEAYRASTDAAAMCKAIVVESAMEIQGRRYVRVEGWQAIAIAHGCTASARNVERVDGGFRAIGEVRRMDDGTVIAEAEGFVGEDEPTWFGGEVKNKWGTKQLPKRPDYAIRCMAQTRAISRACRSAFAHVVVMMNAGLSTTPAEEVPHDGFEDSYGGPAPAKAAPNPQVEPEMISDDQRDLIMSLAPGAGKDVRSICEAYGIKSLKDLTAKQAVKLIERLRAPAPTPAPAPNPQASDLVADEIPY